MRVSNKYFKLQECILDGSSIAKWKWSEVLPFKLERLLFKISFSLSGAFSHLLLELYQSIECNLCSTNCFGEWTTQISKKEKGIISTNVQGVCDPNLKFIYVLPGWEGFISNGRVLRVVLCIGVSIGPYEPGLPCASSAHIKKFGLGLGPEMILNFLCKPGSHKRNGLRAEFGLGPNS